MTLAVLSPCVFNTWHARYKDHGLVVIGAHTVSIRFLDSGIQAYSFSFG